MTSKKVTVARCRGDDLVCVDRDNDQAGAREGSEKDGKCGCGDWPPHRIIGVVVGWLLLALSLDLSWRLLGRGSCWFKGISWVSYDVSNPTYSWVHSQASTP